MGEFQLRREDPFSPTDDTQGISKLVLAPREHFVLNVIIYDTYAVYRARVSHERLSVVSEPLIFVKTIVHA